MGREDQVRKALAEVIDPELGKNIVELGMVKEIRLEGEKAFLGIALTVAGCPLRQRLEEDIRAAAFGVEGIREVEIQFTAMSPEEKRALQERLGGREIRPAFPSSRVIAVGSGKGGVGKSTVAAGLAYALKRLGYRVGLLDADIQGFTIPRLLGLTGQRPAVEGEMLLPIEKEGVKVISTGSFVEEDQALIWRGPILMQVLNQLLFDVKWDNPDFMVLDLPPGTGDIPLSVMQAVPHAFLLLVTTPQASAFHVAGRLGRMAQATRIRLLGVVENMAYFRCDACAKEHLIFGKGETEGMAHALGVPVLARLPLRPAIRESSDRGELPYLTQGEAAEDFLALARRVAELAAPGH